MSNRTDFAARLSRELHCPIKLHDRYGYFYCKHGFQYPPTALADLEDGGWKLLAREHNRRALAQREVQ